MPTQSNRLQEKYKPKRKHLLQHSQFISAVLVKINHAAFTLPNVYVALPNLHFRLVTTLPNCSKSVPDIFFDNF